MSLKRYIIFLFISTIISLDLFAKPRMGSDAASPFIAEELSKIPLTQYSSYTLTQDETYSLVAYAENLGITIFELFDASYRYLNANNFRMIILGEDIRYTKKFIDLGQDRVEALLPTNKLIKIELGSVFTKDQGALDIYLSETYQDYIEIGTALYETRFGFKTIRPLVFDDAYGIRVKKLFITTNITHFKLFQPAWLEIHAKGIPKPKKWVLSLIEKINVKK